MNRHVEKPHRHAVAVGANSISKKPHNVWFFCVPYVLMRKHFIILILLFLVFPVFSSKTPRTIDEAVSYFEKKWKKKDKETYKKLTEDIALSEMDFMVGVWIRNEWIRFPKDTTLRYTFHQMGITHADDMSDIILTCVYRKLNNLPFDIESQVKRCKDYWTPIRECEAKAATNAIGNTMDLKLGIASQFSYMPRTLRD